MAAYSADRPIDYHAIAEHRVVAAVVHSSHSEQADKRSSHSFAAAAAADNRVAWAAVAPNNCSLVAEQSLVVEVVDVDTAAFAEAEVLGDGTQLGACWLWVEAAVAAASCCHWQPCSGQFCPSFPNCK